MWHHLQICRPSCFCSWLSWSLSRRWVDRWRLLWECAGACRCAGEQSRIFPPHKSTSGTNITTLRFSEEPSARVSRDNEYFDTSLTVLLLAFMIWCEKRKCILIWWLLVLLTCLCSCRIHHLNYRLDFLKLGYFGSAIAHLSWWFCLWNFF